MVGSIFAKALTLFAGWFPGERKPVQVRADILRGWEPPPLQPGRRGFAPLAQGEGSGAMQGDTAWRDADLKRAIRIAERSGLKAYRIEIAPDGTIAIMVGEQAGEGAGPASS